jgi:hypothetical protein
VRLRGLAHVGFSLSTDDFGVSSYPDQRPAQQEAVAGKLKQVDVMQDLGMRNIYPFVELQVLVKPGVIASVDRISYAMALQHDAFGYTLEVRRGDIRGRGCEITGESHLLRILSQCHTIICRFFGMLGVGYDLD